MIAMSIALISHPDCLLHDMGHSLPEIPARLKVIEDALSQSDLCDQLIPYTAETVTRDQLLRVHSEEYVDYIFMSSPQKGWVPLDPDTWMNPHTLQASLRAAGATVQAVDLVMSGVLHAAYCNVRPPGHHAERAVAMGFCIFNNIAVAAAHALEHHQLKRVAIIDFDAHHGNGIEAIFKEDERVLYCSSFEHPFYPFSGAETKSDHILNIPLLAGSDGKVLREKIETHWLAKIAAFNPEMVFFSAGFDAYYQDEMSDLLFREEDYAWVTREIIHIIKNTGKYRIISALEGGYDLKGLGSCVVAHIRELIV